MYQSTEVWAIVVNDFFQLIFRPYSIFLLFCAHSLLLVCSFFMFSKCRHEGQESRFPGRILIVGLSFNILGGQNAVVRMVSIGSALGRLASFLLVSAACIVYCYRSPSLAEHVLSPHQLPLVSLGAIGVVLHVCFSIQQFLWGRWKFDLRQDSTDPTKHGSGKPKLNKSQTLLDLGGIVQLVNEKWAKAHQSPSSPKRVPSDVFCQCFESCPQGVEEGTYKEFLNALFNAALGLMLPKKKLDLGPHCFAYATLLAREFEEGCRDKLGLQRAPNIAWFDPITVRAQLKEDWIKAKGDNKNVNLQTFKEVLKQRHDGKLGNVDEAKQAFDEFLERAFTACSLLDGYQKPWLNKHGFFYASFFAYEFYFADARDHQRSPGCGSSTPVADTLSFVKYIGK